jgi:hypothetical protein
MEGNYARTPQPCCISAAFAPLALLVLAACDAATPLPKDAGFGSTVSALVLPASGVIVSPVTAGDFGAFSSDNSGRTGTEFWDNMSADAGSSVNCNVGFYAAGVLPAGACINAAAGSDANQVAGVYTTFFGDGAGLRNPTSFMFKGDRKYVVTLRGSYAGLGSTVGFFTKSGSTYSFNSIANWSNKVIGSTVVIDQTMTRGLPWGFYIKNGINPNAGGCASPDTDCSDAEDGFIPSGSDPFVGAFQQFALFANSAQTNLLVGAEDNRLELLPNGDNRDSDYNDYIWSISVATGGSGCSPGYWKNHSGWPSPYSPGMQFSSVFSNAFPGKTMQQVISQGGGGLNALGRQTVSALMNAASLGLAFELSTNDVISRFNAAFASGVYEPTKNQFEALTDVNGRGCPNPASN